MCDVCVCVYICVCVCIYIYIYTYLYVYVCMYVMEHYSAMEKNEILPYEKEWNVAICSNMSEIARQRKTNTIWYHSYM